MDIRGSSSLGSAAVVWEKCCVIPVEDFVSCVSSEIFLAICNKHVLQNSLGFVLFLFVSFLFFFPLKAQNTKERAKQMRKRDMSLPSCVVTGQRLCISLKDFMVYFPSTRFNFLLALILKLLPHFTEPFHFSFHLALFFPDAV